MRWRAAWGRAPTAPSVVAAGQGREQGDRGRPSRIRSPPLGRPVPPPSPAAADCTADVSDCSLAEKDSLRDWQARLYSKYPIVGELAGPAQPAAAAAGKQAGGEGGQAAGGAAAAPQRPGASGWQ